MNVNHNALSRAVHVHNEALKKVKTCRWFALCGKQAVALRAHAACGLVPVCDKHAKFGDPKPTDIFPL